MIDHRTVKLGKRAPKLEPGRRLMLAKYTIELPAPPDSADWTEGITEFGMMLNDNLGDCTIAAVGHAVQIATLAAGAEVSVPDSIVLAAYEAWDGYVDGDPSTDQGGVEVDVLNDWRQNGFAGHLLTAYADPDPGNNTHVKQAIATFGGLYIGLSLPLTAQNQEIWDVVAGITDGSDQPGSYGGHAVFCVGYDANYITFITWGVLMKMTWAFWAQYCDESHCLVMADFPIPVGVDQATWLADVTAVAG